MSRHRAPVHDVTGAPNAAPVPTPVLPPVDDAHARSGTACGSPADLGTAIADLEAHQPFGRLCRGCHRRWMCRRHRRAEIIVQNNGFRLEEFDSCRAPRNDWPEPRRANAVLPRPHASRPSSRPSRQLRLPASSAGPSTVVTPTGTAAARLPLIRPQHKDTPANDTSRRPISRQTASREPATNKRQRDPNSVRPPRHDEPGGRDSPRAQIVQVCPPHDGNRRCDNKNHNGGNCGDSSDRVDGHVDGHVSGRHTNRCPASVDAHAGTASPRDMADAAPSGIDGPAGPCWEDTSDVSDAPDAPDAPCVRCTPRPGKQPSRTTVLRPPTAPAAPAPPGSDAT